MTPKQRRIDVDTALLKSFVPAGISSLSLKDKKIQMERASIHRKKDRNKD